MPAMHRAVQPPKAIIPKHSHYVSMNNDGIYPAMGTPSGYEDAHPDEWRPATHEEVTKYKAGVDTVIIEHVDLSPTAEEPERAAPATITLAEEDPEPPAAAVPPGPAPVMVRSV